MHFPSRDLVFESQRDWDAEGSETGVCSDAAELERRGEEEERYRCGFGLFRALVGRGWQ